jgi:hypothetical protein
MFEARPCPDCDRLKALLGDLWCLIDDINYHIPAERFKDFEARIKQEGIE